MAPALLPTFLFHVHGDVEAKTTAKLLNSRKFQIHRLLQYVQLPAEEDVICRVGKFTAASGSEVERSEILEDGPYVGQLVLLVPFQIEPERRFTQVVSRNGCRFFFIG